MPAALRHHRHRCGAQPRLPAGCLHRVWRPHHRGPGCQDGKVATDGWSKLTATTWLTWARNSKTLGVESIIYTDIGRDGMLSGINIEATVKLAQALTIPVIASGGLSNMADIEALCAWKTKALKA
jgi:phosphoribosylformimino-5-aminoimidazole carboxamide ribotide isomerase